MEDIIFNLAVRFKHGRVKICCRVFWWGNLREGDHLEDPGVDGRIILKCYVRMWDVGART
jgi:hypothetical protein